ncbi:GTPase HflX [Thalassospira xiamenensis]|uniref:GTPase HflX n=2 Tax=Thalassospira TaxID=168934 RepID=A0AB72UCU8_9PROT|nr:GTPase [Thalassospira xiamenensis M-5 = DSM 17429]KEO50685.1 GTPase HflX [Thalassospira permensis NBRC 106175]MAL28669.1 GTPase HflX [Thalassospira sp.]OCK09039.1 GTP-binding protein, HflX [Thalassospira sp. KO164]PXX36490.1 GTP-binding protein HflX [Thalassospira sp. 11-3]RCK42883.1 GTPase HflX [Thalassospira xiamenensis]SEE64224.1 GTP-binding protein HflX [Thalassospira permensis]
MIRASLRRTKKIADESLTAGANGDDDSPRVLVFHPELKRADQAGSWRDASSRLEEAVSLTGALDFEVVGAEVVPIAKTRPATLFGTGVVERLGNQIKAEEADIVMINGQLSPIQQRNLEREWKCKVIDRTGLILEIFADRARTREGRLQVQLALLSYQKSRLVRTWTHLERQRGGRGFLAGPGERQIEIDRRLIGDKLAKLRRELEEVKRTRELHREARRRVPYPIVALVGYTNAGKSTLFNQLTVSDVFAEDMLFATLDPTMRGLELPSGRKVILSDTVGFVSDLPHDLVAAFRATLEEVLEADLIVHVRDASSHEAEAQKLDVLEVLKALGLQKAIDGEELVEALNKCDQLEGEDLTAVQEYSARNANTIAISAIKGTNCDALLALIEDRLTEDMPVFELLVPYSDGKALARLYEQGEVLKRIDGEDGISVQVRIDDSRVGRFEDWCAKSGFDLHLV